MFIGWRLIRQFFKQKLDWLKYQIVPSLACCFTVLFISNVVKSSTGGSPPGAPVNIVKEVDQSFSLMCAVVLKHICKLTLGVFVTYYVVKNFLSCSLPVVAL